MKQKKITKVSPLALAPTQPDDFTSLTYPISKKYTAGLTSKTERALAEKAGHLEMLGGGKKKGIAAADKVEGKGRKGGK